MTQFRAVTQSENGANAQGFFIDIFLFSILIAGILFWYLPFSFVPVTGDDIVNLSLFETHQMYSDWRQILFGSPFAKYRPVFGAIFYVFASIFGRDFQSYLLLNVAIQLLTTFLVASIIFYVSRSRLQAWCAAVCFAFARFAYYQMWQGIGGMLEGLALFMLLSSLLLFMMAIQRRSEGQFAAAALVLGLCTFTHERYIVCFFPAILLLATYGDSDFLPVRGRLRLIALYAVIAISNPLLKTFVAKSQFFVGTGGKFIEFNAPQIIHFFLSAVANTLGINVGDSYLSSEDFVLAPLPIKILSGAICVVTVGVIVLGLIRSMDFRKIGSIFIDKNIALVSIVAFFCLAMTASITFRQEYRWIYSPYIFLIVLIFSIISKFLPRKPGALISILLVSLSIPHDLYYRIRNYHNLYFMAWMQPLPTSFEMVQEIQRTVLNYGPKEVYVGQAFNAQASGDNGVWLAVTGDPVCGAVYIDDTKVPARCVPDGAGGGSVSFAMPKKYTETPSQHVITFVDQFGRAWAPVVFKVNPAPTP
ncbi:glycosyltransferase family 39 protein [Azospirillum sp. B4]|uniref:glycosyltransferase family 39 protein n=1 Tax=Azospirillum sp. B4 TaxID=95605 RepID=UPI0003489DC5|nr:glycosyltransferase family 39 protein [Azospirillum sp. B4]